MASVKEAELFKWAVDSGWQSLGAISDAGDTLAIYAFRRKAGTDAAGMRSPQYLLDKAARLLQAGRLKE